MTIRSDGSNGPKADALACNTRDVRRVSAAASGRYGLHVLIAWVLLSISAVKKRVHAYERHDGAAGRDDLWEAGRADVSLSWRPIARSLRRRERVTSEVAMHWARVLHSDFLPF